MSKIFNFFAVITFFIIPATSFADKIKDVDKVRKAIVTINSRVAVSAYQNTGNWSGTGFVVDHKNGYLVTNNHVSGRASVGNYFITFHNGQQAEAKVVYYDMYADFSILKVNPKDFPKEIEQIEFASREAALGDEVFIVGNTEGQGFSFHSGYLSDLYEINGEMPQASYVINLNSTGGASGSPILNENNRAIGVLYGGGKTHALAFKSSYVRYILDGLKNNKTIPARKHIGVITSLYSLDKAVRHRGFLKEEMEKYIEEFPYSRNRVVVVSSILSGSTAENELKAGDILWRVNGKKIAADLSILDLEMNKNLSDKIALTIIRNGRKIEKKIKLYDIEQNKINRILDFAGGLFFEVDDFSSSKSGTPIGSVALANVKTGSSFSDIAQAYKQNYKNLYRIVLKSVNGVKINSLSDLIAATSGAVSAKDINIEYSNFQPYYPSFSSSDSSFISSHEDLMQDITFDKIDAKPRIIKFNPKNYDWESEIVK